MLGFSSSGGSAGLTSDGVQAVVSEHCEFGGHREGSTKCRLSVQDIYAALIGREGPVRELDLHGYHRGLDHPDPGQGRYGHRQAGLWFQDVGREQLRRLPGTKLEGEMWVFVGVDPDDYPEEHVRELEELRDEPRARAKRELDDLGVDPGTDRREALLKLHDYLADVGSATSEQLDDVRRVSLSDHADDLARLPSVKRTVKQPPEPEDIQVETYADVLAAREAVETESETEWRYSPDNS